MGSVIAVSLPRHEPKIEPSASLWYVGPRFGRHGSQRLAGDAAIEGESMGVRMLEDDPYISSMLDLLNLRFGPFAAESENENFGGIYEMVKLQKEFQVFKPGRSFRDSAAVLNLGGFWSMRAKNRWYALLDDLKRVGSNKEKSGNDAIVAALIENLAAERPLPVHFKAHDWGTTMADARVLIESESHPVVYDKHEYLTISLPMKPRDLPAKP